VYARSTPWPGDLAGDPRIREEASPDAYAVGRQDGWDGWEGSDRSGEVTRLLDGLDLSDLSCTTQAPEPPPSLISFSFFPPEPSTDRTLWKLRPLRVALAVLV
jgi:hypothetical protein